MKEPRITQIDESTWNLVEGMSSACMYLLAGKERALLIDTGFGLCQLDAVVRRLTDLPVIVVNTHGHYDHTGGNRWFDEVYLSEKDEAAYQAFWKPETIDALYNAIPKALRLLCKTIEEEHRAVRDIGAAPTKPLPKEGYFDLGGRRVSFFETPGHTPGSIALYDEQTNGLFVGDSGCKAGILLQLPYSLSPETFVTSAERMLACAREHHIEKLYPGHCPMPMDVGIVEGYRDACRDIAEGRITEKERKNGSHTVRGAKVSFNPQMLHTADEPTEA